MLPISLDYSSTISAIEKLVNIQPSVYWPMKVEMEGEKERRARHRDKNQVFAEDSQALDQIAKQVWTITDTDGH